MNIAIGILYIAICYFDQDAILWRGSMLHQLTAYYTAFNL